ncbi:DNA-directed RNA polymerase subunit A' [Candidatus Woesearchaeota archaeon]|nr:DNA-directed RNA polymerase subunit A' [Candidatus Woesearchaeota archaeon]
MQTSNKKVKNIQFKIFSPKLIKQVAAAKVVTPELYDKEGYPVDGGLMDIRLGVVDPGLTCKTCGNKLKECPGHHGYIELARPVVHIMFVTTVLNLLRCTCRECGRILASDAEIAAQKRRLKKVEKERGLKEKDVAIKLFLQKIRGVSKCPHCRSRQVNVSLEKPTRFLEKDKRISPIELRSRLEKIPDKDIELFGIDPESMRPEWTVLTVLPIPSVSMRPSITLQSGERSEDDLTHKLGDIVRINQRLFENINAGAPEIIIEDLWDLLQYHVTTFFKNNVAQLPPARHRSGEPLKTLRDRIESKQGRIRHNLAGKRTNFSARSVISPDAMLKINEVGMPSEMTMKLTVPERVNPWNIEYLKTLIEKGPLNYPGANYVIRPDGRRKRITDETKEELLEELEPGYIVERHIIDGDLALFNRQPSLHRMSMMCHKVKVLDGKTFRLNVAVCHPYNADFDGDEMNLHVPQTEEARAEAELLLEVPTQLVSPALGLTIMGCTQDAVTGNYILTKDLEFDRNDAVQLLYSVGIDNFNKFGRKEKVSGKDVFSVLLPDDFDFLGRNGICIAPAMPCKECKMWKNGKCELDARIEIKDGKLLTGIMDAKQLSAGKGLLLRTIHKQYGSTKTAEILTSMFKLGIKVLLKRGFTIGLSDVEISEDAKKRIEEEIEKSLEEVERLIEQYKSKELTPLPGRTRKETLEIKTLGVLNKARNAAGEIVAEQSSDINPIMIMARCGRAKLLNLAMMSACVGQQSMRGQRIGEGYVDRSLPCFRRGDLGAAARGFIKNGFKHGLQPSEFFYGAMTGRDSLMDTALRTPKSGYLYRRLSNAMQDLKVEYDGTVRDCSGQIVQFEYGEDGIDVSKSEQGTINVQKIITDVCGE